MTHPSGPHRRICGTRLLLLASLTVPGSATLAQDAPPERRAPFEVSTTFVQGGWSRDNRAFAVGATWDWAWTKEARWGRFTGYWESSIGRWRTDDSAQAPGASGVVTQLGITPVFRLAPFERHPRWFGEFGIGANVLFPVYQSRHKQFSTTFNFGDHLAVGYRVGPHELALRWQHFSNAGIRRPNPGENFVQLRYAFRY